MYTLPVRLLRTIIMQSNTKSYCTNIGYGKVGFGKISSNSLVCSLQYISTGFVKGNLIH